MKIAIKVIFWLTVGILAIVLLAVATLPLWVNPVVTTASAKIVPFFTGTDFKMEEFHLNPYTGKLSIKGVDLSNPQGYDEPSAVSVHELRVDLDIGSLFTDVIHVRDITIEEPFVSYVFDADGTNNFERILANVEDLIGKKKEKEEKDSKEIRFLLDRIAINGVWVRYRMIKMPVPVPTLRDIGGGVGGKGATGDEVVISVWNSVKDTLTGVGGALGSAATLLGNGATNGASATVNAVGDGATATVNAVGDGAKAIGDGAKAIGDSATDAFKKMGNLFKK